MLNALTNSVRIGNKYPCEVVLYDAEKRFDSLLAKDCLNDIYEAGCDDDKPVPLQLGTENASVAIKSSQGITKIGSITNIFMQGGVFGSLFAQPHLTSLSRKLIAGQNCCIYTRG